MKKGIKSPRLRPGWSTATKLAAAALSTAAALVSVLRRVDSYVVGDSTAMRMTVANLAVSHVALVPAADTALAIGDTLHLAARVTDRRGTALLGATILWTSANPEVATVDGAGTVIARGPGTAIIAASVGDHIAQATVVVAPRVARVRIVLDSAFRVREGDTSRAVARATDAHGYVIPNRTVTWRVADTAIATVDSSGLVTGSTTGRTTLTATVDGVVAQVDVDVVPALGSMTLVSGEGQRASAGTRLPKPITVQILSRRGRPVPGATLHFTLEAADGAVEPAVAVTDARGQAHASWVLGSTPGEQRLVVTADGLDSVLTLAAEADPVAANTRIAAGREPPSGRAGEALVDPISIRVTDSLGAPLTGIPVSWTALDGGAIQPLAPRTDSLGEARAQWTLGPKTGTQHAQVRLGSGHTVRPFTVTAVALAGAPAVVHVVSGNEQRGVVGAALAKPIVLRVTDRAGNGVAGAVVRWSPAAGSIPDSTVTTDTTGRVAVAWTLGRFAGRQRMRARVDSVATVVEVTAIARPRAAANVAFLAAPPTGTVGRTLKNPVRVQVTDVYGNPVSDVLVVFTARSGRVAPARVMTDEHGVASTRWTLGRKPGEQTLAVSVRKTEAKGELVVQAVGGR